VFENLGEPFIIIKLKDFLYSSDRARFFYKKI